MSTDLKIPPQDLQAEQSVLSVLMQDPTGQFVPLVADIVTVQDFYNDHHGMTFQAILDVHGRNGVVTYLTLKRELQDTGRLDEVGGEEFLWTLKDAMHHFGPHAPEHARVIADLAVKRRCLHSMKNFLERGYDESVDAEEMVGGFAREVSKLQDLIAKRDAKPQTMREHMLSHVDDIEQGVAPTKQIMIEEVDKMTGGAAPGEMIVIGGLTSMGKTLIAQQCAHEAAENGMTVLVISNEMPGKQLSSRLLQKATRMPADWWKDHSEKLREDINGFYNTKAPIVVVEGLSTISEVERVVAREVRNNGIGLVVLDYIQLVRGDGQSQEQQTGDASRRFKQLLLKHKLIGIMLSQLNRSSAKDSRAPVLSDLRNSGSIEQDADIVLFAWWEAKQNSDANIRDYKILQAKNRPRGMSTPMVQMSINPAEQWLYPHDPVTGEYSDFM